MPRWQVSPGTRGLNSIPHPETRTLNHLLSLLFSGTSTPRSCLCGAELGRMEVYSLRKTKKKNPQYYLRAEATGTVMEKWMKLQSAVEHGRLFFPRFVRSDALERLGSRDTFSFVETPFVTHIKTQGKGAADEKEKSYWCGTNRVFFFH